MTCRLSPGSFQIQLLGMATTERLHDLQPVNLILRLCDWPQGNHDAVLTFLAIFARPCFVLMAYSSKSSGFPVVLALPFHQWFNTQCQQKTWHLSFHVVWVARPWHPWKMGFVYVALAYGAELTKRCGRTSSQLLQLWRLRMVPWASRKCQHHRVYLGRRWIYGWYMGEGEKSDLMRLGDVGWYFCPPNSSPGHLFQGFSPLDCFLLFESSLCFVSAEVCFSNLFFIFQSFLHHKAKEHRRYNMF